MTTFSLALYLLALALFMVLAYWRNHGLLFLLVAAMSLFVGFQWYEVYTTDMGLAFSICFMANALVSLGMAIRAMVVKGES